MVLNDTRLKHYQEQLLDDFAAFLARARELGDPAPAFVASTRARFGYAMTYHPLPGAEHVPYVCLRVPTGGGKTRVAGQSIRRVLDAFLAADHALVLWLVPSDPIREQTLHALRAGGELLHQDMRDLFGAVHVLDIEEALFIQPATLATGTTIIVATMQGFKRDNPLGLRVYKQDGQLMGHFNSEHAAKIEEHSLVDVIRLHHPYVIIDEAHNQGAPLAIETLVRLNPSCVLELTATPDRMRQPSNVLCSVSAATLQAEDMLKLPLELATHPEWKVALTEAMARLRQLEQDAETERRLTGERIEPVVMLLQAERHAQGKETFTAERVRQILIDDFKVPEETVAIATGALDELTGRRPGDPGYPQFIITVDKLREGWDCPVAYILFTFRNTTSATAVEQVLGRVLRMPHVTRKQTESLNRSYAYVVSSEFSETVRGLRDGLVQSGFERYETNALIRSPGSAAGKDDLFPGAGDLVINLPATGGIIELPKSSAVAALPKSLRDKVEVSPENNTLTIRDGATRTQIRQVADTFADPEAARVVRERLEALAAGPPPEVSPAERGEKLVVPLLAYVQADIAELFDETPLLEADWDIADFDHRLTAAEFSRDVETMRRASLTVTQLERITCNPYDRLDAELALLFREEGWTAVDLVSWLDRNIPFPYSERARKVAWLNAAVDHLIHGRGITLEELVYRKFRLRGCLERKMAGGMVVAKQGVFAELLRDESRFTIRDEHAVVFELGRYPCRNPYKGPIVLHRRFFHDIDLSEEGEEFECAEFIANRLEGVKWWVRNIPQSPTSFWLQTASDRFYPDFVVQMENGQILVVEYKGKHIADTADSREKKAIGELWARRSNGTCRFVWVEDKNWRALQDATLPR